MPRHPSGSLSRLLPVRSPLLVGHGEADGGPNGPPRQLGGALPARAGRSRRSRALESERMMGRVRSIAVPTAGWRCTAETREAVPWFADPPQSGPGAGHVRKKRRKRRKWRAAMRRAPPEEAFFASFASFAAWMHLHSARCPSATRAGGIETKPDTPDERAEREGC